MVTAPVRWWKMWVAFERARLSDELHCLEKSSLRDVKGTILVIPRSKADRVCVYLLPVL